jgi:hypothetical protein
MRDFSSSKPLFGGYAALFGPIASAVVNRSLPMRYHFIDNDHFISLVRDKVLCPEDINEHVVRELLYNCHMSAILGMIRNGRWIDACWREYEAQNLLAWANNMRALIESVADSYFDTFHLAFSIAENKNSFLSALGGFAGDGLYNVEAFEEKIVHFFQGRKLTKPERAALPEAHEAKPTWQYVKTLEASDLAGLYALYSRLSEISHPSSHSLNPLYREDDTGGWMVVEDQDLNIIQSIVAENDRIFGRVLAYAFIPNFYLLRVLAKFKIFPLHPELKKFDFAPYPKWQELKDLIDR